MIRPSSRVFSLLSGTIQHQSVSAVSSKAPVCLSSFRTFSRSSFLLKEDEKPSLRSTAHIPSVTVIDEGPDGDPEQEGEPFEDRPTSADLNEAIFAKYPPKSVGEPRLAWVESLDQTVHHKGNRDLIRLHPDVWSAKPRLDVLWQNIDWQKRYNKIEHERQKDRQEMHVGPRPWPVKGTGRARHKSRFSPIWYQGGKAHPKRGLRGSFYMLDYDTRVNGLIQALSAKFGQDDLRIVRDLGIGTDDPDYIENLIDDRCWGMSTLIVDVKDIFPANIVTATEPIHHVNLMPCYGLNVHSMLKHKTLVLTVDAVRFLEEKLLFALNRMDHGEKRIKSGYRGYSIV